MPQIGEVKKGREIGKRPYETYIWSACLGCGKERWVKVRQGRPQSLRCVPCGQRTPESKQKKSLAFRGEKSHFWKGGRSTHSAGYIVIGLQPDNFFYPMAGSGGYVLEHRLVVAKALGRNLHPWELVHHKGAKYPKGSIENKQDNRYPENLQLISDTRHNQITILEERIKYLENKLVNCEEEVGEIKKELENSLVSNFEGGEGIVLSISKLEWQAFWQKWGIKEYTSIG